MLELSDFKYKQKIRDEQNIIHQENSNIFNSNVIIKYDGYCPFHINNIWSKCCYNKIIKHNNPRYYIKDIIKNIKNDCCNSCGDTDDLRTLNIGFGKDFYLCSYCLKAQKST